MLTPLFALVAGLAPAALHTIAPSIPVQMRHRLPSPSGSGLHVVVIVQENRSLDYLFNGFSGANTVTVDPYTGTALQSLSLANAEQPDHDHAGGFTTECAAPPGSSMCAMTGFAQESIRCHVRKGSPGCSVYVYAPQSEVAPYWSIAQQGELLDDVFQCNSGPSFPAHQCLIAGQAGGYESNGTIDRDDPYAWAENRTNPTCANRRGMALSVAVNAHYPGTETTQPLCSDYRTIFDDVSAAG